MVNVRKYMLKSLRNVISCFFFLDFHLGFKGDFDFLKAFLNRSKNIVFCWKNQNFNLFFRFVDIFNQIILPIYFYLLTGFFRAEENPNTLSTYLLLTQKCLWCFRTQDLSLVDYGIRYVCICMWHIVQPNNLLHQRKTIPLAQKLEMNSLGCSEQRIWSICMEEMK